MLGDKAWQSRTKVNTSSAKLSVTPNTERCDSSKARAPDAADMLVPDGLVT
jgi:hypothetical protein